MAVYKKLFCKINDLILLFNPLLNMLYNLQNRYEPIAYMPPLNDPVHFASA